MTGKRVPTPQNGVRRLPSGKWQARFPGSADPMRRPVPGGPFPSEIQARAALEIALEDLKAGRLVLAFAAEIATPDEPPAPSLTVSDVVLAFIDDPANMLSHNTISRYRSMWRTVINNARGLDATQQIGAVPVMDLTTGRATEWDREMQTSGITYSKRKAGWRLLSSALSWEVELGRLPNNPCLGIRRRHTARSTAESHKDTVQLPTWSEFHGLVCAAARFEDRLYVALLGWCGMRFSELAAVEPANLLHATHEILLTHTWVKPKRKPWVKQPLKTGLQRRVYVPAGLWDELVVTVNAWTCPTQGRIPTLFSPAYAVGTRRGVGIWTPTLFADKVWNTSRESLGLTHRLKDLRAYAASAIVDAGGTELEAQRLLGHRNPMTTRNHYLRAQDLAAHDPARAALRMDPRLSLKERLDALYSAWIDQHGNPFEGQ